MPVRETAEARKRAKSCQPRSKAVDRKARAMTIQRAWPQKKVPRNQNPRKGRPLGTANPPSCVRAISRLCQNPQAWIPRHRPPLKTGNLFGSRWRRGFALLRHHRLRKRASSWGRPLGLEEFRICLGSCSFLQIGVGLRRASVASPSARKPGGSGKSSLRPKKIHAY